MMMMMILGLLCTKIGPCRHLRSCGIYIYIYICIYYKYKYKTLYLSELTNVTQCN